MWGGTGAGLAGGLSSCGAAGAQLCAGRGFAAIRGCQGYKKAGVGGEQGSGGDLCAGERKDGLWQGLRTSHW